DARPARRRGLRAHPAADGPGEAGAVPAGALRLGGDRAHPLLPRRRGPASGSAQPVAAHARQGRPGLRLLTVDVARGHALAWRPHQAAEGDPMPRDPNIPDEFDVYTLVILRRADDAPEISDDDLSELQTRHLAYRGGLAREGVLVVNGPFDE